MKKVYFMLADGFEETEFTAPWDLLLRAGAEVTVFSVSGNEYVTGAHGLTVKADKSISVPDADCDLIVLPGGGKGTQNLAASEKVASAVRAVYANGGFVAAICAAPTVLASLALGRALRQNNNCGCNGRFARIRLDADCRALRKRRCRSGRKADRNKVTRWTASVKTYSHLLR